MLLTITSRQRDVTHNVQRASALSLTRRYAFANGPIRTPYIYIKYITNILISPISHHKKNETRVK